MRLNESSRTFVAPGGTRYSCNGYSTRPRRLNLRLESFLWRSGCVAPMKPLAASGVSFADFEAAIERVVGGLEQRSRVMNARSARRSPIMSADTRWWRASSLTATRSARSASFRAAAVRSATRCKCRKRTGTSCLSKSSRIRKTSALAYLAVLAALRLDSGVPFHVKLAKQAGASRDEVISALLGGATGGREWHHAVLSPRHRGLRCGIV